MISAATVPGMPFLLFAIIVPAPGARAHGLSARPMPAHVNLRIRFCKDFSLYRICDRSDAAGIRR
jgi:hypothetical protein